MTSREELADVRERVRAQYARAAGITVTPTHQVADGPHPAIFRAARS